MNIEDPAIPIMQGLPKIHKEITLPSMRPNVLGIGPLNERLYEWLGRLLKPVVLRVPGYLQEK